MNRPTLDQVMQPQPMQPDNLGDYVAPPQDAFAPTVPASPGAMPSAPMTTSVPALQPRNVGYADGSGITPTRSDLNRVNALAAQHTGSGGGAGPVDPSTLQFAQPGAGGGGDVQPIAPPRPQMVKATNMSLVDPGLMKQQQGAFAAQQAAIGGQQEAQTQLGRAEASSLQQQANAERYQGQQVMNNAQDSKAEYIQRQAAADQQHAKVSQLAADVAKDYEQTPDKIWANTSTFDKVRFGLADILGGFNEGFTHGAVKAVSAVQSHIQGEIASARENYERHNKALGEQKGIYADLVKRAGTPEEADKAYHALLTDAAGHEAKAMAIESGSPTAIAKADLLSQTLEERKAQVGREAVDQQVKESKFVPAHMAAPAVDPNAPKYDPKAQHEISKEREAAGIPAFEANEKALQRLIAKNGGEIPGTGVFSRAAHAVGAESIRGTEARQVDGIVTSMAEAMAHANGQRGTEAIEMNKQIIRGNGSQDDLEAGIGRAHQVITARAKGIGSGHAAIQNDLNRSNFDMAAEEPGGKAEKSETPDDFEE